MNPYDQVAQQALSAWKQLVEAGFEAAGKALAEQRAYALRVADIFAQSASTKP